MGADSLRAFELHGARKQEMIFRSQLGLPAGLNYNGLVGLNDDGSALDAGPELKLVAHVHTTLVPRPGGEDLRAHRGFGQGAARASPRFLAKFGAPADRLNRYSLDHQPFCAIDESEA